MKMLKNTSQIKKDKIVDMIADMHSNKKLIPIIPQFLDISLIFIKQFYFLYQKMLD